MNKRELIAEYAPDAMLLDEQFDHCILGTTEVAGETRIVYDEGAVIEQLEKTMGEDAQEWYEFNILQAYVPRHPLFVSQLVADE